MKLWVLGSVEVIDADQPLALSNRQRALLAALLARSGEVVSADRLAELLWGDAQPADPVGALHSLVSRLRRMLGPDVLATRPPATHCVRTRWRSTPSGSRSWWTRRGRPHRP